MPVLPSKTQDKKGKSTLNSKNVINAVVNQLSLQSDDFYVQTQSKKKQA